MVAEIAAMEFLFPYDCRLKELTGPLNGKYLEIATKYRIPRVHVERYMSDDYMTNLKEYSHKAPS
jgi:hypothetical protein